MKLEWTNALIVGHETIDNQHRQLFRIFNAYIDACAKGEAKPSLLKVHESLQKYARSHFRDEESLMEQSGYPGFEMHRREHRSFQQQLTDIREAIANEGPTLMALVRTNKALVNWLVHHVQDQDQRFGRHLKEYRGRGQHGS